jgi:hypothetical protein
MSQSSFDIEIFGREWNHERDPITTQTRKSRSFVLTVTFLFRLLFSVSMMRSEDDAATQIKGALVLIVIHVLHIELEPTAVSSYSLSSTATIAYL